MTPEAESQPTRRKHPWGYLLVISLLQTFASLAHMIFAPIGGFLQRDLFLTSTQLGGLSTAAFSGTMITSVLAGWLIDRYLVRRMILVGPAIMAVALLAAGWTTTYWGLWLLLLALGMGNGSVSPLTSKAIAGWFPPYSRGLAMSIKQSGVTLGVAVGALVLPWIAGTFGWQSAFQVAGLMLAVVVVMSYLLYRDPQNQPVSTYTGPVTVSTLSVLRQPLIISIILMGFFYCGYQLTVQTFYVPYLTQAVGFSDVTAAAYLAVLQLGGVVGRPFLGVMSDRSGQRLPLLVLLGIMSAAGGIGLWAFPNPPAWLLICLTVWLGVAIFGWVGLHFALITERVPSSMAGRLIGVGTMLNVAGGAVGPIIFGSIIDGTGSYGLAFLVFSVAVLLVAILLRYVPRWFPQPAASAADQGGSMATAEVSH